MTVKRRLEACEVALERIEARKNLNVMVITPPTSGPEHLAWEQRHIESERYLNDPLVITYEDVEYLHDPSEDNARPCAQAAAVIRALASRLVHHLLFFSDVISPRPLESK